MTGKKKLIGIIVFATIGTAAMVGPAMAAEQIDGLNGYVQPVVETDYSGDTGPTIGVPFR